MSIYNTLCLYKMVEVVMEVEGEVSFKVKDGIFHIRFEYYDTVHSSSVWGLYDDWGTQLATMDTSEHWGSIDLMVQDMMEELFDAV